MLFPQPTYLIDADCIIGLENAHTSSIRQQGRPRDYEYPPAEQRAIWDALRQFAADGHLKVIPEVVQEVADYAPEGAKRLRALPSTGVRRGRDIDLVYQNIIAKYPRWQTPPTRERDYADPWLIATASVKHFQILTDESPAAVQSRSRAGLPKIPDVAPDYLVAPKVGLRQFAKERGWLPT